MNVFIVTFSDGNNSFTYCGVFSTQDKAKAYITRRHTKQRESGRPLRNYEITEAYMD